MHTDAIEPAGPILAGFLCPVQLCADFSTVSIQLYRMAQHKSRTILAVSDENVPPLPHPWYISTYFSISQVQKSPLSKTYVNLFPASRK
jgi:hypothetical protein